MAKGFRRLFTKPGEWEFEYKKQDENKYLVSSSFKNKRRLPENFNYVVSATVNMRNNNIQFMVIDPIHCEYQIFNVEYSNNDFLINKNEAIFNSLEGLFYYHATLICKECSTCVMIPREFLNSNIIKFDVRRGFYGAPEIVVYCILDKVINGRTIPEGNIQEDENTVHETKVLRERKLLRLLELTVRDNINFYFINHDDFFSYDRWSDLTGSLETIIQQNKDSIIELENGLRRFRGNFNRE